jgi:transcriptional regulator with XRE-family HTH domain
MEKLRERIELLISTKGMTNATFAEKIGVQPSNISHVLSGRNKPSLDLVMKILNSFKELKTEWLLHGQGSMTRDYTLFELDDIEEVTKTKDETLNKAVKTEPVSEKTATDKPLAVKHEENYGKSIKNEVDKEKIEEVVKPDRKIEKKNPHKKSVERIVIFYEDKSFSEYFPEG